MSERLPVAVGPELRAHAGVLLRRNRRAFTVVILLHAIASTWAVEVPLVTSSTRPPISRGPTSPATAANACSRITTVKARRWRRSSTPACTRGEDIR